MCDKESFSVTEVKRVMKSIHRYKKIKLRKYFCKYCAGWHITSSIGTGKVDGL